MIMQMKKRTPNPLIINGKLRMEKVREAFKGKYTAATLEAFPHLNNKKGLYQIENAWRGNAYHLELIEFWEKLAGINSEEKAG